MADLNISTGSAKSKSSSKPSKQRIAPQKLAVLVVGSIIAAIILTGTMVFAFRDKWDKGSQREETRTGGIQPPAKSELARFKDLCGTEGITVPSLVKSQVFKTLSGKELAGLDVKDVPKPDFIPQLQLIKCLQEHQKEDDFKGLIIPDDQKVYLSQILGNQQIYELSLSEHLKNALLDLNSSQRQTGGGLEKPPHIEEEIEKEKEEIPISALNNPETILDLCKELLKGQDLGTAKERLDEIKRLREEKRLREKATELSDIEIEEIAESAKNMLTESRSIEMSQINLDLMFGSEDGPRNIKNPQNLCYINCFFQSFAALFKYLDIQKFTEDHPQGDFFHLLLYVIKEIHGGRFKPRILGRAIQLAFLEIKEKWEKGQTEKMFSDIQADVAETFIFLTHEEVIRDFSKFFTLEVDEQIRCPCYHRGPLKTVPRTNLLLEFPVTKSSNPVPIEELIKNKFLEKLGKNCPICGKNFMGQNDKYCENETVTLKSLPQVLTIQMNTVCLKVVRPVTYKDEKGNIVPTGHTETVFPKVVDPLYIGQTLILSPSKAEYMLFSVISQSGTGTSGHYIPTVRVEDDWFKCNDQADTTVKEDPKQWEDYLSGKYGDADQPFTPFFLFYLRKDIFDAYNFKERHIKKITDLLANNINVSFIENSESLRFVDSDILRGLRKKFTEGEDILTKQFPKLKSRKEDWNHLVNYKSISEKIAKRFYDKNKPSPIEFDEQERELLKKKTPFDATKPFFGEFRTGEQYDDLIRLASQPPKQTSQQETLVNTQATQGDTSVSQTETGTNIKPQASAQTPVTPDASQGGDNVQGTPKNE